MRVERKEKVTQRTTSWATSMEFVEFHDTAYFELVELTGFILIQHFVVFIQKMKVIELEVNFLPQAKTVLLEFNYFSDARFIMGAEY